MIKIPEHVMQPGNQADFIPQEQCRPLKSAGIGYSVFKALGARKGHSSASIKIIQNWCQNYCEQYLDVVPDQRRLKKASFSDRLFAPSQKALENVVLYYSNSGHISYKDLFQLVWIEQKWPELCHTLANGY